MWRLPKTMSQIYTSIVKNLMISILPQETAGYIIYLSFVGDKCQCTILAIVLFKLFLPKSSLLHRFWKKELEQYNGKDGALAFISYKGKIYDVSSSFLWQNGNHQVLHNAGVDLTHSLGQAPHGEELLESFPVVGTLQEN